MERPRIIRFLRIGWTGLFAVLCGLLIALWVRSFYLADIFELRVPFVRVVVDSAKSRVGAGVGLNSRHGYDGAAWGTLPHKQIANIDEFSNTRFKLLAVGDGFLVQAPHWFLILLSIAFAVLSWTRWKYSLRTLLIATTFVAVLLGLIAVAIR